VNENNQFGREHRFRSSTTSRISAETAEAYGIPGFTIDGMDITAVAEAVGEARERSAGG